jgi:hypothetical protein
LLSVDPLEVGWRIVDGCALAVRRTGGPAYRLSPAATAIWLTRQSPDASNTAALLDAFEAGQVARPITDIQEIAAPIAARPGLTSQAVGDGFVICSEAGAFVTLSGNAADIWRGLLRGPTTFAALLDEAHARRGAGAESDLESTLRLLAERELIDGVDRLTRFSRRKRAGVARPTSVRIPEPLLLIQPADSVPEPPRFSRPAAVRDDGRDAAHVAIVCQYGIAGLAPGVHAYAKRCIARLHELQPDLIVVSGGGRHGLSPMREGESVIDRYRDQLPGRTLWLESHSKTTWENLQQSLEMLQARSLRPRRISFVGDRARTEKLRLCCWLAQRRFAAFRRVSFQVVPIRRARSTWRDTRIVQLAVGCAQVIGEARRSSPAMPADVA